MTGICSEAGILNKTKEYYRQALFLEPKSPVRLNNLVYFLIDKDRDINKGLELVDKALELNPDNFSFLNCKGWDCINRVNIKKHLSSLTKAGI